MAHDPLHARSKQRVGQPPLVTAQELRDELFTKRRPVVKPLFDPDRPVGVPFEHAVDEENGIFRRLARIFGA